jgi:thioredoxin reductase (NADPH)
MVDNYPGFPEGVEGMTLAAQLEAQAKRFGAVIKYGEVSDIQDNGETKTVIVDGKPVQARTVLIATGSDYNKIGVPGEAEYYGRGVHYCATCDGAFYRDKHIAVIGGGNSAVQEALFLTRFASKIDMFVRSSIKASEVLQHELTEFVEQGKIEVHLDTSTDEILAPEGKVNGVKVTHDGVQRTVDVDGVFVFVGLSPNTEFLQHTSIELDEQRLIKTDDKLMTSMPGVFASGDVRSGATMQIASAVGEGAAAALSIREYLENLKRSA